jgi:hypothetical protein
LTPADTAAVCARLRAEIGRPVVDPLLDSAAGIVEALRPLLPQPRRG